jgi:hypothetical protein
MWRVARILGRRWRQPILIRWLEAFGLFGVALTIRFLLGPLLGTVPFLSFYPAILLAALLLGWKEAVFVLVLSLAAGLYFFLPTGTFIFPASAALVGVPAEAANMLDEAILRMSASADMHRRLNDPLYSARGWSRCCETFWLRSLIDPRSV